MPQENPENQVEILIGLMGGFKGISKMLSDQVNQRKKIKKLEEEV